MDAHESTSAVTRRHALRAGIGTAAGAATLGIAGAGSASAQTDAYGGHLSDAEWDGTTVDASGADEVVVDVGAGPNGFQFNPPAIYIEPGQTITWTWTGEGGGHNVVNDEGVFDSRNEHEGETASEEGFTYEAAFEDAAGSHPYVCMPHEGAGMKGVVVVGEDNVETELASYGDGGDGGLNVGSIAAGTAVFGVLSLIGIAAYSELVGNTAE